MQADFAVGRATDQVAERSRAIISAGAECCSASDILQGIAEGRVTLALRRWRRAPPADGSALRSPVGVLCLDRVTVVDEGDITADDVRRTGMSSTELRASIAGEGRLLRIELRLAGDDPRLALRERLPDARRVPTRSLARLARIDAASPAPWTTRYLQTDRRPTRGGLARARAAGGRRGAAVQASRPAAEGAWPHREPRGSGCPASSPRGRAVLDYLGRKGPSRPAGAGSRSGREH